MCRNTGSIGLSASGDARIAEPLGPQAVEGKGLAAPLERGHRIAPGLATLGGRVGDGHGREAIGVFAQRLGDVVVLARERDEHRALDARLRHAGQQVLDPGLALRRRQLVDRARQLVRAAEHMRVRVDDHRRCRRDLLDDDRSALGDPLEVGRLGQRGHQIGAEPDRGRSCFEPVADLVVADAAGGQERGAAERAVQRVQVADAERPRREELDHAGARVQRARDLGGGPRARDGFEPCGERRLDDRRVAVWAEAEAGARVRRLGDLLGPAHRPRPEQHVIRERVSERAQSTERARVVERDLHHDEPGAGEHPADLDAEAVVAQAHDRDGAAVAQALDGVPAHRSTRRSARSRCSRSDGRPCHASPVVVCWNAQAHAA